MNITCVYEQRQDAGVGGGGQDVQRKSWSERRGCRVGWRPMTASWPERPLVAEIAHFAKNKKYKNLAQKDTTRTKEHNLQKQR